MFTQVYSLVWALLVYPEAHTECILTKTKLVDKQWVLFGYGNKTKNQSIVLQPSKAWMCVALNSYADFSFWSSSL